MGYFIGEKSDTPQNIATAKQEAKAANGAIRYFSVVKLGSATPQDDVYGAWQVASTENVELCSAVAWNFGVELHDKLNQPIGLLVSAMGGTAAEAWLPKEVIDGLKCGPEINGEQAARMKKNPKLLTDLQRQADEWLAAHPTPALQEADSKAVAKEPGAQITHIPSRYYNGMIHGIEPYSLKGVIWFQRRRQHPTPGPIPGANPSSDHDVAEGIWRRFPLLLCGTAERKRPAEMAFGGLAKYRDDSLGTKCCARFTEDRCGNFGRLEHGKRDAESSLPEQKAAW